MIKKLRRKFIWIAMCSVMLVLGTIVAVINVINYSQTAQYSDKVITILVENEGGFPQDFPTRPNKGDGMTPETPFETRFFTVMINTQGEVVYSDTSQIMAVTKETAEGYAKRLYEQGKSEGMYDDYKYRAQQTEQGTLYIFLDCTREMNSFRNFLQVSLLISLGGVAVVFVLIIIFSKIALRPIEESYQKQKNFITNASHDIKTPLTIINAGTELIELEKGEDEWTREIKKQTQRLTTLTDKLVFLSRMDEENQKIEIRPFDLSQILEETLQPYENIAKTRALDFVSEIQKDVVYHGNEEMLGQAFALLLDNAMKYTNENGKISVSLKKTVKGVEIRFKNTAKEVKIGNNTEIFERFYRADKSRNSKTGGHGIGLSVVKAIVTAHKGKISAYSVDGKSLEFLIVL